MQDVGDATGFSPTLQLPAGSDILLGEEFACYVRLINLTDVALSRVAVKVAKFCFRLARIKFVFACYVRLIDLADVALSPSRYMKYPLFRFA